MTTIEKMILKVLTNEWQTLPRIQSQVALKMGVDPNRLEVLVPFYCGVLVEHNKIQSKPVPLGDGAYHVVCRNPQPPQEVPY